MSIKIMNAVWSSQLPESVSKNKRSTVKIVLLKLADNANDNGKCWPSIPRIAHETELSERSVIRALDDLKDSNLIHVKTHRKNGVKHNTYYINTPLIDSLRSDFESTKLEENDNPFTNPSDNLSDPSDTLSKINDRMAVKPSLTTKEPSNTEHFSKEKRIDVFSLDGYEYCKESIKHLIEVDTQLVVNYGESNIYTGWLTIDQIETCEDKLREVLSEPSQCSDLICNIYQDRGMWKNKSVSLPYILMAFTDVDQFSHLATNCNDWTE